MGLQLIPHERIQAKHPIYVKIQKYELTHSDGDFLGKPLVISWGVEIKKGGKGRFSKGHRFPKGYEHIVGC